MNDLDYYMSLPYRMEVIEDKEEGGFVVTYPELSGCVTAGNTIQEAISNALDAKREWMSAMLEDDMKIPEPDIEKKFSGSFTLRIPKALLKELYFKAQEEGVSMNQYCCMLLSRHAL